MGDFICVIITYLVVTNIGFIFLWIGNYYDPVIDAKGQKQYNEIKVILLIPILGTLATVILGLIVIDMCFKNGFGKRSSHLDKSVKQWKKEKNQKKVRDIILNLKNKK